MLLKALGSFCERWEALLSLENLRQWPLEHADTLAMFFQNLPCDPQDETWPCGKKELLLAAAFQDSAIPKVIRVHLWRCLVMNGYPLPRYQKEKWNVPLALYDHRAVRRWFCQTKQEGYQDYCCSDRFFFVDEDILKSFKTDSDKRALEAIKKDSPPMLLMPFDIAVRQLPYNYMQVALIKEAKAIVTYLCRNNQDFNKFFSPRQLLFYVCSNWNDDNAIPFVTLLEEEHPGLVKHSLDVFGHDALWYTLYKHNRFNLATDAVGRAMPPLDKTLIELGCDPDRKNSSGLSYNDLTM